MEMALWNLMTTTGAILTKLDESLKSNDYGKNEENDD
jgi:hypothetical protein